MFVLGNSPWWDTNLVEWSVLEDSIPGLEFAYGTINNKSKVAHIRSIIVDQDQRCKGVGRAAVQELEQFLIGIGAKRINGWAKEGSEAFWRAVEYDITPVRGHLPRISKQLTVPRRKSRSKTHKKSRHTTSTSLGRMR